MSPEGGIVDYVYSLARGQLTPPDRLVRDESGEDLGWGKMALAATGIWISYCQIRVIDQSVANKEDLRIMMGDGLMVLA